MPIRSTLRIAPCGIGGLVIPSERASSAALNSSTSAPGRSRTTYGSGATSAACVSIHSGATTTPRPGLAS